MKNEIKNHKKEVQGVLKNMMLGYVVSILVAGAFIALYFDGSWINSFRSETCGWPKVLFSILVIVVVGYTIKEFVVLWRRIDKWMK